MPIPRALWVLARIEWWIYRHRVKLTFIAGMLSVAFGSWWLWGFAAAVFALGVVAIIASWIIAPEEPPQQQPSRIQDL